MFCVLEEVDNVFSLVWFVGMGGNSVDPGS